jgi:hypothetical protein
MKKIIVSAAVAAMALSTTASALEDIKVNGQAKLWYETSNSEAGGKSGNLFSQDESSGEVAFKLGMTGKQGDVGFGATVYQTSTMGLETSIVSGVRTNTNNLTGDGKMFVGESYITAPMGADTVLKFGKQELDTPLAFTERWNAVPNTFNAAVAINSSVKDLTLIGAYVGQDNAAGFQADGEHAEAFMGKPTFALAGLYKTDALALNVWAYDVEKTARAIWVDAAIKAGPANVKAYLVHMMEDGDLDANSDDSTSAVALSAGMDVSGVNVSGAFSMVTEDGALNVANLSTGGKKTMLPTAAVYLDGKAVAMQGATAVKVKAAGKVGETGLAAQFVMCNNDAANGGVFSAADESAHELDIIATAKLGAFNIKGIVMHRGFENTDAQQHIRVITSVNF